MCRQNFCTPSKARNENRSEQISLKQKDLVIYPLSFLVVQPQLTFALYQHLIAGRAEVLLCI